MAYLMGIDIGTSSAKTVIFTPDGTPLAPQTREYTFDSPSLGWAEQDPAVWWEGVTDTVRRALAFAHIDPKEIKGIGLSGQMHGLIALDMNGCVVRKAILHCDVRSTEQVAAIRKRMGGRFSEITYNPIFPGFLLLSLLWVRDNEPDCYRQIRTVMCPKDYIRYRLTGELGTEATDASGTLAYDMNRQDWSDEILDSLGLDRSLFPDCKPLPFDIAGEVTEQAARQTGLAAGTPVVYGGGDQAMHSLGNGVYQNGVMTATIGTSGQVLCVTDTPVWNPALNTHTFRHVADSAWFGLGAVLHAGVILNWFRREFAGDTSYVQLDEQARRVPACCDGLVFFPCMGGERTPYMDAEARGMLLGMTLEHTRAHVARAIMEGVTFAMKDSVDILLRLYPGIEKLICAGGGAKSDLWLQMQADIYGQEVFVSKTPEQACTGAAIVAGIGCGAFSGLEDGCAKMVSISDHGIRPSGTTHRQYSRFYQQIYAKLYQKNRGLFPHLAAFSS